MLKKMFFYLALFISLTGQPIHSARAEELPAPQPAVAAENPAAVEADPLTVTDVIIDKTAKNAVVARNEAIAEAQHLAFQKWAERSMPAEDFKAFQMPDDAAISAAVADFEIKSEQLSTTRYVGNFTVRFRKEAAALIGKEINTTAAASTTESMLVLPYFEDNTGKATLWSDPNPWRQIWQSPQPNRSEDSVKWEVPLGDVNDVAFGSDAAIWNGDYTVLDKLQTHYNAQQIVIPVVSRNNAYMTVDLYTYKDKKFTRHESLTPYVGSVSDNDAFRQAYVSVLQRLQKPFEDAPQPPADNIAWSDATETEIAAAMQFEELSSWMDVQKRISSVTPAISLNIKSISKDGASFTMKFGGNLETLKQSLAEKGILLSQQAIELDDKGQRVVYDLKLVN